MDERYSGTPFLEHERSCSCEADGSACRCEKESGWVVEKPEDLPLEFGRKCLETGSRAFDSLVFHCLQDVKGANVLRSQRNSADI
jgi:hypothetical protein